MPPALAWCSPLVLSHPCGPAPLHYLGLSLHHKGNILNADPKLPVLVVAGLWGARKVPGESQAQAAPPDHPTLEGPRAQCLLPWPDSAPQRHLESPRLWPEPWAHVPMEVNMPAVSGTLLDWKPTGPAGDTGGLQLLEMVCAAGTP